MNTLKLSLSNFQAISEGILEFKTGLNFIIGQSNSGKTATFRAVKDCLLNPSKSARHIKSGTGKAVVTLEYNGNVITWTRTSNSSVYDINGQEYIKVGRSNAFKLLENETGFVLGSSGVIMNIEEELQAPFPFGMSKQDLFKLYEDVFCISDSAVILKAAKGQEEQVKFDIGSLENEILKNNKKIEELEKFKVEVNLDLLKSYKASLIQNSERLIMLKKDLPDIKVASNIGSLSIIEAEESFVNILPEYRDKVELKKLSSTLKKLHKLASTLDSTFTTSSKLVEKREELLVLSKEMKIMKELDDIKVEFFEPTAQFIKYEELKEVLKIRETLKEIKGLKIPSLELISNYEKYKDLKDLSKSVKSLIASIKSKEQEYAEAKAQEERAQSAMSSFKVCPLCRRPLEL